MLSFQFVQPGDKPAIQIYCDDEGLTALIDALQKVRSTGHAHLCAPSSGGKILSDRTPFGDTAIGEVIVTTGGDI